MSKFNALVSEKIYEYAPDMKHFHRACLRPFLDQRLTSLYVVNITPNSKLHPPTKIFRSAPGRQYKFKFYWGIF